MLDIISDLKEKKSEVISLHEVITTLKSQSPQATLPQIAEWLLIQLADNPESPEMGILTVGGGFESILPEWMSAQNEQHLSLRDLLIELYRSNGIWPGDIPF